MNIWDRPTGEGKVAGEWDCWTQLYPRPGMPNYETFSVSCFQWVQRGKNQQHQSIKMGRIQKRFTGTPDEPDKAVAKAKAYCEKMNKEQH